MSDVVAENMGEIREQARKMAPFGALEEMVQETVLCILDTTTFDHSMPAGPWIYWRARAARHRLLKSHYRHHPHGGVVIDFAPTVAASQEHVADVARVLDMAARLPPALREVVELTMAGMAAGEIGAALGISRQGAHQRLQRARIAMKIAA